MSIVENEGKIGRAFFAEPDKSEERRALRLSSRQSDILNLIAKGYSTQDIADLLIIESETVKSHRFQLYRKLRARSGLQAVLTAVDFEIINLDDITRDFNLDAINHLTPTHLQVLEVMTANRGDKGYSAAIAAELNKNPKTIDAHFDQMFGLLGICKRIPVGLMYMAAKKAGILPSTHAIK